MFSIEAQGVYSLYLTQVFGYISWIVFIVDIYLLYKLYQQQRAAEFVPQQQAGQPGVFQQPAVVIVPQGAKPLVLHHQSVLCFCLHA